MSSEVRCWYLNQKGKATGPYAFSDLKSMAAQGSLKGHDLVFREGSAEWKRAYDWPELVQECFSDENRSSLSRLIKLPEEERAVEDQWVLLVREDGEKEVRFRQKGPFQTDEIRRMLVDEKIKPSDHIWKKGAARWVPLYDVPEFRVHNLKMTKAAEAALNQVASMPDLAQAHADPFAAMMPATPDQAGSAPVAASPAPVKPVEAQPDPVAPAKPAEAVKAAEPVVENVAKKTPAVRASIPSTAPEAEVPAKAPEAKVVTKLPEDKAATKLPEDKIAAKTPEVKPDGATPDRQAIREWALGLVGKAQKEDLEAIAPGKAQVFSPEVTKTDHEISVVANPAPSPQSPSPQSLAKPTPEASNAPEPTLEPMPVDLSESTPAPVIASEPEVASTLVPILNFESVKEEPPVVAEAPPEASPILLDDDEPENFVVQALRATALREEAVAPAPVEAPVEVSSEALIQTPSPAPIEAQAEAPASREAESQEVVSLEEPVPDETPALAVEPEPAPAPVAIPVVAAASPVSVPEPTPASSEKTPSTEAPAPETPAVSASPSFSDELTPIPELPVAVPAVAPRPAFPQPTAPIATSPVTAAPTPSVAAASAVVPPVAGVEKAAMPIFATSPVVPDDGSAEEIINPARLSESYSFETKSTSAKPAADKNKIPAASVPAAPMAPVASKAGTPAKTPAVAATAAGAVVNAAAVAKAPAGKEAAPGAEFTYDFEPPKTFFSKAAPFFGVMVIGIFGAGVWATLNTDKSVFQSSSSASQIPFVATNTSENSATEPIEVPPSAKTPPRPVPPVANPSAAAVHTQAQPAAAAAAVAEDEGPEMIVAEPPAVAVATPTPTPVPKAEPAAQQAAANPAGDFDGKNPIVRINTQNNFLEIMGPFRKGELLRIRIEGRAGQILDLPALVQKYEVRAVQDHYYRVSVKEARIPKGEYLVAVQFGMNRFSRGVGHGKDGGFREALQGHRKAISYDQQQERKRLLQATKDFAQLLAKAETSAKDAGAIKSLQRELDKKTPRELRLVRTNRYELIFFDYWEKLAAQWERVQVTMKDNPGRNPASVGEFSRARKMATSLENEVRSSSIWN